MSEISTFVSASPGQPAPRDAAGYPQPGRCVAVLGDDGQPVPRGQAGQLTVAADDPGLMLGYWGAAAESAARLRDGWFLTGDTAKMTSDGAIAYLGRDDDMINAGGFRVSPLELEATFNAHPGIAECAAVELTVRTGVNIIALAYLANGADPGEGALTAHAQAHLARYKQPRLYRRLDALPHAANNKLDRRKLRQEWGTMT